MEQFVLLPASVYNRNLITQSVMKQEFTNYQPSQKPSYQIDSLKEEINTTVFAEADFLVDKNLACPCSSSQVHKLQFRMSWKL